jgi:hypothetical protein
VQVRAGSSQDRVSAACRCVQGQVRTGCGHRAEAFVVCCVCHQPTTISAQTQAPDPELIAPACLHLHPLHFFWQASLPAGATSFSLNITASGVDRRFPLSVTVTAPGLPTRYPLSWEAFDEEVPLPSAAALPAVARMVVHLPESL